MKEFAAALVAPLVIALMFLNIVLTLVIEGICVIRDAIDSVCASFTEYFSDVL